MKRSEGVRFADVTYDVWPAASTNVLQQSLRQISFLISASDQELSQAGEDNQRGVSSWAAAERCPSDREAQEQPCHEYREYVLSTPALSDGLVTQDCDVDLTEGTERGGNLVEAGFSMSTKVRESVLMIVSSMTRQDEDRSLV